MKTILKLTAVTGALFMAAPALAGTAQGKYLTGDFHQHSYYTDGSHPIMLMMEENNVYLDWWANSEHGGARKTDGEGVSWLDTSKYPTNPILGDNPAAGNMYRWQSLRDFVYPQLQEARSLYPDKTIISGLEQNTPGHEHTSTAIGQFDGTATAISEFEYRFDKSDKDTSRNGQTSVIPGMSPLSKTNVTKDDAIASVAWLQAMKDAGIGDAWYVPAHVERARSYTIEDFRDFMDAGPDVAIGFEGIPGHQVESGRGGFGSGAVGHGAYGGAGFYVATVGGLWDALSAEGRKYFNFASSDCHENWTVGGGDFWPGEYQKIYTYIDTAAADPIEAVFEGNRSGNSWDVMGDLIDELEFTAKSKNQTAVMGQTLKIKAGDTVQIKIKVHDPAGANNCPFDMNNPSLEQVGIEQPLSQPELDHIDLIAGTITGNVPETNVSNLEATDYGTDAAVAETFRRHGGADKDGYLTYVLNIKPKASMFLRLRGTNLPANVPYETDAAGNPLLDSEAANNIYGSMNNADLQTKLFPAVAQKVTDNGSLKWVAAAYADLWFYSNPIYIEVTK
jgi:hypothetical protein